MSFVLGLFAMTSQDTGAQGPYRFWLGDDRGCDGGPCGTGKDNPPSGGGGGGGSGSTDNPGCLRPPSPKPKADPARAISELSLRLLPSTLAGSNGVPRIYWHETGINGRTTSGPYVRSTINGTGFGTPVFLGNGAAFQATADFDLPLNGFDWNHTRVYSSQTSASG